MSFIVLPRAQAALVRKALARLDGLPRRATVMRDGEVNAQVTEQLGAQLDTTDCVDAGDDDGDTACIELPGRLAKHLGKTITVGAQSITLPTREEMLEDEDALPATLKAVRVAKRDARPPVDAPLAPKLKR